MVLMHQERTSLHQIPWERSRIASVTRISHHTSELNGSLLMSLSSYNSTLMMNGRTSISLQQFIIANATSNIPEDILSTTTTTSRLVSSSNLMNGSPLSIFLLERTPSEISWLHHVRQWNYLDDAMEGIFHPEKQSSIPEHGHGREDKEGQGYFRSASFDLGAYGHPLEDQVRFQILICKL